MAALRTLTTFFNIPVAPTPELAVGTEPLGSATPTILCKLAANGSKLPTGMVVQSATAIYVLVDGSSGDEIWKLDGTVTGNPAVCDLDTSWATSGKASVTHQGSNMTQAEGIAIVGSSIYVSERSWNNNHQTSGSLLKFAIADGAEQDVVASSGDNSCGIPDYRTFVGLQADGTRLWGINDYGNELIKLTTSCLNVGSLWLNNQTFFII